MISSKTLAKNIVQRLFLPSFKPLTTRLQHRFSVNTQPSGDLYTWADSHPQKVQLPEKVRRASLGQSHTAIVTENGNLYTYGANKYGQLGHGDHTDLSKPKLVDYFEKKGIKIKEALCGEYHTIALSEDGKVYTFGNGGKKKGAIWNLYNVFASKASPLGHGNQQNISKPKLVNFFQKNIVRITAGNKFNFGIDEDRKVFFWGSGEYGVVGDGSTKSYNVPTQNEYFDYFEAQENLRIKKLKSCATHNLALMENGRLYGWGSNHAGQIGIKNQIGIELHQMVNYPQSVIREGYEDHDVVNFDVSQNICLFELSNGQMWWCGGHLVHKPQKVNFEQQNNIKLFAAGVKSYVIVSKSNNIYAYGRYFESQKKKGDQDLKTGIYKFKSEDIFKGEILGIGGQYTSKYAIIKS